MRVLLVSLFLAASLSGCVSDDGVAPGPVQADPQDAVHHETFRGVVLSANTPAAAVSPDQAGDVERWFYVHENTTDLTLRLRTNQHELRMEVRGPGCHAQACAVEVKTEERHAKHTFDAPATGPWEVAFFLRDDGAEEVYYELDVTKEMRALPDPEQDVYDGAVVALHLGAIRISPDQLGDVYREFWVHEDTARLTIDLTTSADIEFVVGQSLPTRDRGSEQSWTTTDGRLELVFDDPQPGGWYFILFHEPDGPGVADVTYRAEVTKDRAATATV